MNDLNALQPRRRHLLTAVGVAGVAGVAGALWRQALGSAASDPAATAFLRQTFQTPDGAALSLAAFKGRPLLVNFWAPWCAPCVEELPMLNAFHEAHRTKGWQLVGLAVDRLAPVQRFLQATPVSFPVALTGLAGIQLSRQLGNESGGLPFSLLFDRSGRIRERKLGQLARSDLEGWVLALA